MMELRIWSNSEQSPPPPICVGTEADGIYLINFVIVIVSIVLVLLAEQNNYINMIQI